jgi:hypothetical protein
VGVSTTVWGYNISLIFGSKVDIRGAPLVTLITETIFTVVKQAICRTEAAGGHLERFMAVRFSFHDTVSCLGYIVSIVGEWK